MASFSSFTWLLCLMACFCNSQSNNIKIRKTSEDIQISQNMALECVVSSSDSGIYWIHQDMDHKPQSIVYVSTRKKTTPAQLERFSIDKIGFTYKLTVKHFKKEDQGIYFCAAHHNQNLIFSSNLEVYLPVTTTTPSITTQRSTTPHQATKKEPIGQDPSTSDKELSDNGSCAPYILIPLAGGCFLLLIILVITLFICCDPRRRRRTCRCHRPMNGTNGKHSLPH